MMVNAVTNESIRWLVWYFLITWSLTRIYILYVSDTNAITMMDEMNLWMIKSIKQIIRLALRIWMGHTHLVLELLHFSREISRGPENGFVWRRLAIGHSKAEYYLRWKRVSRRQPLFSGNCSASAPKQKSTIRLTSSATSFWQHFFVFYFLLFFSRNVRKKKKNKNKNKIFRSFFWTVS